MDVPVLGLTGFIQSVNYLVDYQDVQIVLFSRHLPPVWYDKQRIVSFKTALGDEVLIATYLLNRLSLSID